MDAESVRRVMDRFYDVMRTAVTEHGGTVVKFMGDGLMAAFGVPTVNEDDAIRAVRSAAAMQAAFTTLTDEIRREWDAHVGLRIGVNTGEVVVVEGEDDVVGDAVNVAARLEHTVSESGVLVGEETWRLTRHLFTFEHVDPLELKGKAERVRAFRLMALTPPDTEEASPFVGREQERARLTTAFDAAVNQRRAHLVTLVGSPGLGKSRLVREFVRGLGGRARVFEGQCESRAAATFAPAADVLRGVAGIEETASPEEVVDALTTLFADSEDATRLAAGAATALGVGQGTPPEETFWAIRRVIEQVAARQPAVVVFDDVQWAEPLLLDLIEHLAEWTRESPVLLVALARPEIRDVRASLADPAGTSSDVIVLDALPATEGLRLASELLQGHRVEETVAHRLLAPAEGNPLFLRELVKMLLEDGVLHLEDGVWVAAEGAAFEVPPTIHALLSARIERLESDERTVVERAAVVGHQFFRGAVAVLAPTPVASRIDLHLETLRRKQVVEPEGTYWIDEPVFRFHHGLIRDAAYRRLLKEVRAELHERVADWLVVKAGDLVGEHDEVVGFHFEQAFTYRRDLGEAEEAFAVGRRAAAHLGAAARRALDRDDLRSAAALMERALCCLPDDAPERLDLLVDRCEALLGLGEVAASVEALAELQKGAEASPRLAAWAEAFAAQVASFSDPEALHEWVDRAAAAAGRLDDLGDRTGTAKAASVHASILARLGQVGACEAALDRALAAAREAGDRRRANGVLAGAPLAALWGPSPVTRAAGRCLDVVRVLRITTASPAVEAVALRAQGVLEAFRGRFDAARRLVESSRKKLEELGLRHGILQADLFAGLVELVAGDAAAAERFLRSAYEGFRSLGVGVDAAQAGALLARACLAQGRDDEALALTRECEHLGGHDLKTAIAWRSVQAEALARRGDSAAALRLAREAVNLAAPTDALVDHADARLALAAVLAISGDAAEGAGEARKAIDLYQAKGASALAERAAALVEMAGAAVAPPQAIAASTAHVGASLMNLVTAVWDRYRELFPKHDVEGILATVSRGYVLEERQLHAQHTVIGHDGFRGLLTAIFEGEFVGVETEVVATRGERIALVRVTWHVRSRSGGEIEVVHLRVDECDEGGILTSSVAFDAEDLDAAFDELDRRFVALVGIPEVEFTEPQRALAMVYAEHDLTEVLEAVFVSPDVEVIDHRPAGWGPVTAAEFVRLMGGLTELISVGERRRVAVFRLREPFAAVRQLLRGVGPEGEAFEVVTDLVVASEAGRISRMELFAPEDLDRALARFDELVADTAPGTPVDTLALRTNLRGKAATEAGDIEGILAVVAEDFTVEERTRSSGLFPPLRGKEALRDYYALVFTGRVSFPQWEVVAVRGERLLLTRALLSWTDGAGTTTEHLHLRLDEVDESGLITAAVLFDADDTDAAFDEMDERYLAHVDAEVVPHMRLSVGLLRAYNARHWEGYRAALSSDRYRLVDHRPSGWGECDADEHVSHVRGLVELVPDIQLRVLEYLRLGPGVALARGMAWGTDTQGGRVEVPTDILAASADGQFTSIEFFDPTQRAEAVARFEALTDAPDQPSLTNEAARTVRALNGRLVAGDVEGVFVHYSPDLVSDERRRSSRELWQAEQVKDWVRYALESYEVRDAPFEPLAVRGERLVLGCQTFVVTGDVEGEGELRWLQIAELGDDGLVSRFVMFEPDDLDAAFDELDRRFLAHIAPECRPLAEIASANQRAANSRDWEAMLRVLSDDFRLVDHRLAGFGERDAGQYIEGIQAVVEMAPDLRARTEAVMRVGADAILSRTRTSGSDGQGGRFEQVIDSIGIFRDGRLCAIELFDPAQEARSVARFEELAAVGRPADVEDNVAARAWRRASEAMCARDVTAILAGCTEDVTYEERKHAPGRFAFAGRDELGSMLARMVARGAWRIDVRVVATRGERLVLTENLFHYTDKLGGPTESLVLRVDETDAAGRISATIVFEPDDLDVAMDELDARYRVTLPVECRAMFDTVAAGRRVYNAHDFSALRALLSDDFVLVDHRPGWFGTLDVEAYVERTAGILEVAPDAAIRVVDIPCIAPDSAVIRWSTTGRNQEGGIFEITFDCVVLRSGDQISRFEFFAVEQRDDAMARFEERSGDAGGRGTPLLLTSNAAVRVMERIQERMLAGDFDGMVAHHAPDIVFEERRQAARETYGPEGLRRWASWMGGEGIRYRDVRYEPLAVRSERVALGLQTYRGVNETGGEVEISWLLVTELDESDFVSHFVMFEPDDFDAAMEELDERWVAQLDPEEARLAGVTRALRRAINERNWDGMRGLLADDFVVVDSRLTGAGEGDAAAYVEAVQRMVELAPDFTTHMAEAVNRAGRVGLGRTLSSGTSAEGGRFETSFYALAVGDGTKLRRLEAFELSKRAEAMARFDVILGRAEERSGDAGAGPALRVWGRFVAALETNALDDLAELVVPGYRDYDHINNVVTEANGQLENQRVVAALKDLSIDWAQVLDLDQVAVVRATYRWAGSAEDGWGDPGAAEHTSFMVAVVDEAGRAIESHRFAEDQLHAALAVAEQHHAETASEPRDAATSRRLARTWKLVDSYNAGDWATLASMWAEDVVTVDHRPAGWGTVEGRPAYLEVLRGLADVSGERRWVIRDLLHRGARTMAAQWSVVGADLDGGPFEMVLNVALALDPDGQVTRQEIFAEDDADAAVAAARALDEGSENHVRP
jgi:class 3 adenylate cyclase/ketosteroid isomerase-like protein/tetratricopeptide (TPR) repeat protein